MRGYCSTNADLFQLWRNGQQVRLFTSVSGAALGAADYIEFWGERNDGKADALYLQTTISTWLINTALKQILHLFSYSKSCRR
jgi:hypothetical protein